MTCPPLLIVKMLSESDILWCAADLPQVLNVTPRPQQYAATAKLPQKRKRRSAPSPNKPSAEHPKKLNLVSRPLSNIPPAELPVVSDVLPSPRTSTADNQPSSTAVNNDSPLRIHNYSVEDYQQIYHEVVDDMLRYVCVFASIRSQSLSLSLST